MVTNSACRSATAGGAGHDSAYNSFETQIAAITQKRDQIAGQMIAMPEAAAFQRTPINEVRAASLLKEAEDLVASIP